MYALKIFPLLDLPGRLASREKGLMQDQVSIIWRYSTRPSTVAWLGLAYCPELCCYGLIDDYKQASVKNPDIDRRGISRVSKRCVLYKPNPSLRMGHCAIVSADHCVFFNVPRRCGTWIGAPLSESGVSPLVFIAISGFYPEPNPDNSRQYKKTSPKA